MELQPYLTDGHCRAQLHEWGASVAAVPIRSGADFWYIVGEFLNDEHAHAGWLNLVASAFRKGMLFGLRVQETPYMRQTDARSHAMFAKYLNGGLSWYLLPCFVVRECASAILLWVHPRVRRNGLGTALVRELGIATADNILPEAEGFWVKALG
jgi:GNAT superfamily N-acetyltransferase